MDKPISICGIWDKVSQSIQEVLESNEYKDFIDAGAKGSYLFVPFPINSRFRDFKNGTELFFCKDRMRLVESLKNNLGKQSIVVPVSTGTRYTKQAFRRLAATMQADNAEFATFGTIIKENGNNHTITNQITPWNVVVTGEAFLGNLDAFLDLFISHHANGLSGFGRTAYCDEQIARVESQVVEKEYRVFSALNVTLDELQMDIEKSRYLLSRYVEQAITSGKPDIINRLPYSLLDKRADVPVAKNLNYNSLKRMDSLLAEQRWGDLAREAGKNLSASVSDRLKIRSLQYRAIAYANQNMVDKALADLKLCMQTDPSDITTPFLIGRVLLVQGHYKEAVKSFSFCAERNRHDLDVFKYLAFSHYKTENYQQTVQILEFMLKVFDYDPSFLRFLLHTSYMAGNMQVLTKYANYIEPFPPLEANFHEKEWILIYELIRNLKDDMWVVDVGANVGEMSRNVLQWGHRCLSIESDEDLYSKLGTNLSGFNDRSIICRYACSSEDGTGQLRMGLAKGNILDDLLTENGIEKISLLRIDVEGHELEVLRDIDWSRFDDIQYVLFGFDLILPKMMTAMIYYLFGCGFRHGLIFQRPNEYPTSYNMAKLVINQKININPKNGRAGNILLSKMPLFNIDESMFLGSQNVFAVDEVRRRLNQ